MNEGVQILIERMKTNPEEFVPEYDGGVTKWGNVIGHYKTYLTNEDSKALDDAWRETVVTAMQEKFTQVVMKELLDPKFETNPYLYSNVANGTVLGGTTLGAYTNTATTTLTTNSLTLGKTTVTDTQLHELLHMKAQIELERQKQKQSKTLFGRLFNYA